jgi:Predicted membrane-associated, metal-dependent hydrolase
MIRNVMETNPSEARDLISLRLFLYLGLLALVPLVFVIRTRVHYLSLGRRLWSQFKIITASLLAISLTLYISFPSYASLARNNHQLSHLVLPTNFIFAGISYAGEQFKSAQLPFKDINQGAVQHKIALNPKKKVLIMIIGETARADRFSINGYHKETNPKLKNRQLVNFKQTRSCGTNTATSLPCLFSSLSRTEYNHKTASNQANLLDFFKHVGMDVLWRDNNTGCKGLCARTAYQI